MYSSEPWTNDNHKGTAAFAKVPVPINNDAFSSIYSMCALSLCA